MILVSSAQIVSKYGYEKILQPLLDDIRELKKKNSFETSSDGVTHIFYRMLSVVVAVNLAVHALAGVTVIFK